MKREPGCNERRAVRVRARGCVAVHGDGYGRGKIVDLSTDGMRLRLTGPHAPYRVDGRVDLDLRFDGATGGWWRMSGRIVRVDARGQLAVAFDDVPTDFEDRIQAELVAALEEAGAIDVLIVDPVAPRRGELAVALRAAGRHVSEAATPLDAIDQLGESRHHPGLIVIADTVPASIANELRAHVRVEHPDVGLVRMMGARDEWAHRREPIALARADRRHGPRAG